MAIITTGAATAGVIAYLSKDGINKLLGPTLDYFGNEIKDFTEKRHENLDRIISNARKKVGDTLDEKGAVPPKVFKRIVDDGSLTDDPVSAEYFGGVLASSRTPTGRDDRGARVADSITKMSSYQLLAHFIIYSSLLEKVKSSDAGLTDPSTRSRFYIYFEATSFMHSMKFSKTENANSIMSHVFHGLHTDGLIGDHWGYGSIDDLKKMGLHPKGECPQILVKPTVWGIELFLWACGEGERNAGYFSSPSFNPCINEFDCKIPKMLE